MFSLFGEVRNLQSLVRRGAGLGHGLFASNLSMAAQRKYTIPKPD